MLRFLLLLPAALGSPALACAQAAPPAAVVTISGHLAHAPAGDTVRLEIGERPFKTQLDAGGNFQLVLPRLAAASPAQFSYAGQHTDLYLTPGDQLHLTLDFPRFDETLRYTGRGAAANNYLARSLYKFEYGPAGAVPRPTEQITATTTPAQMRQYANAFRQQQRSFMAAFVKTQPLPAAFQRQQLLDMDLLWGSMLLNYPADYRYEAKQPAALPADYYAFLQQLPLKKLDNQVERESVTQFFYAYCLRLTTDGELPADPAAIERLYAQATIDFGPGRARDWAVYQAFTSQLILGDAAPVLAAYPTFRRQNRDSTLAKNMRGLVQKQLALRPGQPAPVSPPQPSRCKLATARRWPWPTCGARWYTSISGAPGAAPACAR